MTLRTVLFNYPSNSFTDLLHFQFVFYVLHLHEFFSGFAFFCVWTGFIAQEPANFLFGHCQPTCVQIYRKREGAGLHQEYFVLRYPLVTQTVLLTNPSLLRNRSLSISLPGHRFWLILPIRVLTQLRKTGLGRPGKQNP